MNSRRSTSGRAVDITGTGKSSRFQIFAMPVADAIHGIEIGQVAGVCEIGR